MTYAILNAYPNQLNKFNPDNLPYRTVTTILKHDPMPHDLRIVMTEEDAMTIAMRSDPAIRFTPLDGFTDEQVDHWANTNSELLAMLNARTTWAKAKPKIMQTIERRLDDDALHQNVESMTFEEFFAGCVEIKEQIHILRRLNKLEPLSKTKEFQAIQRFMRGLK